MSAAVVHQWAEEVRRFGQEWPNRGAAIAAERVNAAARADTGGDGRLSNHRGGAAVAVVEQGSGEAAVVGDGSAAVWAILENGTSQHQIVARGGRLLRTPYGPRRMVTVSGMTARQTWTKGSAAGLSEAARDADEAFGGAFG